MKQSTRTTR